MPTVKFVASPRTDFAAVLRGRVKAYFKENNLSQKDDGTVVRKGIVMLSLYLIPFIVVLAVAGLPGWAIILLGVVQGIGLAGVGMCLMHDSLHGALSPSQKVNERWGASIYLLGGSAFSWKMQHNKAHHTYTNLLGHDEDIRERSYLRFCPHAPWRPIHRYQHWYALLLYPLMTISLLVKDFTSLKVYEREGLLAQEKTTYARQLGMLLFSKGLFLVLFIGGPLATGTLTLGASLLYFLLVQGVAGFIMSVIFQLAHVVEETTHPLVAPSGIVESDWMIHQLETTANFCPGNRLLNYYTGGLNYQVEHHLFPNISHIHYPALSHIVKETATEFGVVYNQSPRFGQIFSSHLRFLRQLSLKPAPIATSSAEPAVLMAN